MDLAILAMRQAFGALARGEVSLPPRTILPLDGGATHLSMPCSLETGELAIKVVTLFPEADPAIRGLVLLHSSKTGELLAIMDGESVTALRTGAASGLATDLLARDGAHVLTVFGAGTQARTQIEAVRCVRPIERILIVNRTHSRAVQLASEVGGEVLGADEAVAAADIVCTATDSPTPLFDSTRVTPGTHINAIGSYRPDRRELDDKLICEGRVYVDHVPAAKLAGEFVMAAGWKWENLVGTLGGVIEGIDTGRTSEDEITVFKSVGVAVQDAVCAQLIYERAVDQGIGVTFDFEA